MRVTNFAELMSGNSRAEIRCLYTGNLVRVLTVSPDYRTVEIDPMLPNHAPIRVPITTPITYEPWMFDRGNMLFPESALIKDHPTAPSETRLKICGEGDPITYPDGESATVNPA
jgi:hypothetical protein